MSPEIRKLQRILDLQKIQAKIAKELIEEGWDVSDAISFVTGIWPNKPQPESILGGIMGKEKI